MLATRYAKRGRILIWFLCLFHGMLSSIDHVNLSWGQVFESFLLELCRTSSAFACVIVRDRTIIIRTFLDSIELKVNSFYRKNIIPLGSFLTKWNR